MTKRQMAILWGLGLIWGTSFLFIRVGVETIPPMTFVVGRIGIAALVLYLIMRWRGIEMTRSRSDWLALAFVGFMNAALPYTLFAWGEHKMAANASGLASIYNASTPLWTILLAQVFVRSERLSPVRTFGILIGFAGVVYLFLPALSNIASTDTWGQIACLIAAACYGVGALFVRKKLGHLPPHASAFGQMLTGTLMLLPLSIAVESSQWQTPSFASLGSMVALAVAGTAFAQILFFGLIKEVGAPRTSQVTYLLPIFALVLGSLVLKEPLRPDMVVGLGIILLGVVIVNGRLPAWFQRKPKPSHSIEPNTTIETANVEL